MPHRCPRPLQIALFYLMLGWLGLMLLTGNLLVLPLFFVPRPIREPIVQRGISLICRIFLNGTQACGLMRLELDALDRLDGAHGMLLAPNHPSMIDAFLILSRIRRAVCLMKASIGANLFLGAGAYLAGYVSNGRPDIMFRTAISRVARGNLLLIFPEGTRTTRQPINVIQGAAGLIARKANAPLQTILITTNSPYLAKGWKIWRPPTFPILYRAEPGPIFDADDTVEITARRLQNYYMSAIKLSIDPNLRPRDETEK